MEKDMSGVSYFWDKGSKEYMATKVRCQHYLIKMNSSKEEQYENILM